MSFASRARQEAMFLTTTNRFLTGAAPTHHSHFGEIVTGSLTMAERLRRRRMAGTSVIGRQRFSQQVTVVEEVV